ncbi:MAG: AtpZ/AtpI family protein [Elusimicrobia bacterium]|nr:AtpZ/AtpI family protein [Elusimicrobiota bacterium]
MGARSKNIDVVFSGTQWAMAVLAGLYGGHRLDLRWSTGPWFLLAGGAVGLAAGMAAFLAPFLRKG